MGFRDLFRATEYKESADAASRRVEELEALLTPEHRQLDDLKRAIAEASSECATARAKRDALDAEIADARAKLASLSAEASRKKRDIWDIDEQVLVQEFGLYQPRFDFQTVDAYKAKISHIRARERDVIKRMNEEAKHANWHVNNSVAEGRKMVGQFTRLLMRAYNSECDELVRRVKFSNIERTIDQIGRLAVTIEKQGTVIGLRIPPEYVSLKQDEARLSYEYACFKEEEKERAREERERRREEMALKREIAEKRKKLKKERELYANALRDLDAQIGPGEPTGAQAAKRAELVAALGEVDRATKDVDYREANQRAGYVYVISNIGSFGEGVYKIGMTRRLDPQERIRELSDASVPFNFDVHAMIFSDDAPGLEAALHREFEDRKVNLVNGRREFFRVTLDEIKAVVKANYDKTVEFVDVPDAEQYRTSLLMAKEASR